jgi:hypothetical protein
VGASFACRSASCNGRPGLSGDLRRLVALLCEAVGWRRIAFEEMRQVSSACCTAYSLKGHSDELGFPSCAGASHTELRSL